MAESMKLPEGKTCGDCQSHGTCKALFGCSESNRECDWFPARFRPRVTPPAPPAAPGKDGR